MSLWEKTERKGTVTEDPQRRSPAGEESTEKELAQPLAAGSVLGLGASPLEQGILQRKILQRQSEEGHRSVPSVPLPYLDAIQRFFEQGEERGRGAESRSER